MKKVLLIVVAAAIMSCGNINQKPEKVLSEGEQSAIAYVNATISSSAHVDSIVISYTDTLLCADMPEIDDSLFDEMCKKFGTRKISEKEFRDFLQKRNDPLNAITKSWAFSRIKKPNARYVIDEIKLDKRWESYWRTVYTVRVIIKGLGHDYRILMDSTGTKAIATEEEFRKMMNEKEDGIFDMYDGI